MVFHFQVRVGVSVAVVDTDSLTLTTALTVASDAVTVSVTVAVGVGTSVATVGDLAVWGGTAVFNETTDEIYVIGNNVADDWTLSATAAAPDEGRNFSNAGDSGVFKTVFANAGYDLAESVVAGYTAGSWWGVSRPMSRTASWWWTSCGRSVTSTPTPSRPLWSDWHVSCRSFLERDPLADLGGEPEREGHHAHDG